MAHQRQSRAQEGPRKRPASPFRAFFELASRGATGRLSVIGPEHRADIFLVRGRPVEIQGLPGLFGRLGRGVLPASAGLLEGCGVLIGRGNDPEEVLSQASCELGRYLADTVDAPELEWRFAAGARSDSGEVPLGTEVVEMLARGLAEAHSVARVERRLAPRLREVLLRRQGAPGTAGLNPAAVRVSRMARKGRPLHEVIEEVSKGRAARRVAALQAVDLLLELGCVELHMAAGLPGDRDGAPGEEPGADHDSRALELRRLAGDLAKRSALAALGLPADPELDVRAVGDAFRRLAAPYHPDRHLGSPPAVQDAAARVFDLLRGAREALRTPEAIRRAVAAAGGGVLEPTGDERRRARRLWRAAEDHIAHRAWREACARLEEAQSLDPDEMLYPVMATFCRAVAGDLPYAEAVEAIDALPVPKVGPAQPWSDAPERPPEARVEQLFRSAWLLKLAGRQDEALARLRRLIELAPDHVGAARELRLHEMRSR